MLGNDKNFALRFSRAVFPSVLFQTPHNSYAPTLRRFFLTRFRQLSKTFHVEKRSLLNRFVVAIFVKFIHADRKFTHFKTRRRLRKNRISYKISFQNNRIQLIHNPPRKYFSTPAARRFTQNCVQLIFAKI